MSVRDGTEASLAIRGGAAIVDVKEPRNGSLGAASTEQWTEVVSICQGQVPLSVALGELTDATLPKRLAEIPPVQFAKIGLAGCRAHLDWIDRWRWAVEQLPASTSAVAVTYADALQSGAPDADAVRQQAIQLGCRGMLWDTCDKTDGNLFAHISYDTLAIQVAQARQSGLFTVLAGSLAIEDLAIIGQLAPDYVAIRGAACAGSRKDSVQEELVRRFADAVNALEHR